MGVDPNAEQIRASRELQALATSSLHHLPSLGAVPFSSIVAFGVEVC